MTVSVPNQLVFSDQGNGATTVFEYPVKFLEASELVVISREDDVDTVLTLNTHYTVSGAGVEDGGSITMLYVPTSDETIIRYRDTAAKQIVNLADSARNPAEAVEQQLDRLAKVDQDQGGGLRRAWKAPVGTDGGLIFAGTQGKFAVFDNNGDIVPGSDPGAGDSGFAVFQADTAADIRTLLDLEPGTDVQAQSAILQSLADETLTAGDILYAADADTIANLPIGTDGQALGVVSGELAWFDAAGDMTQAVYDPQGKAGDPFDYDTEADFEAANIPLTILSVVIRGYYEAGDGGGHTKRRIATPDPVEAWHKQSADGAWWEVTGRQISVRAFGAKDLLDDAAFNSTEAVQNAIVFVGEQAGGRVIVDGFFGIDTVDIDYSFVEVRGWSAGNGFKSLSAAPCLRSLLANRVAAADAGVHTFPAGSLQGVVISNLYFAGDETGTHAIEFERFTRGCLIELCLARRFTSHGFKITQSFSFNIKRNWSWDNGGWGFFFDGDNPLDGANAIDMTGNHAAENALGGAYINKAQSGFICGNTFEYNAGPNLVISGKGLTVTGNYIEAFSTSLSSTPGQEYQVILGTDDHPFMMSMFHNYINGGSNSGIGFFGDGIKLYNVIESEIRSGGFAASARYELVFDEAWTCIGNRFIFGFTQRQSDLSAEAFRNLTTSTSGGIEVLKGTNCRLNTSLRTGDNIGVRNQIQIPANGSTGSVFDWFRAEADGQTLYRVGKRVTSTKEIEFSSLDSTYAYRFTAPVIMAGANTYSGTSSFTGSISVDASSKMTLPVVTTTERNALTPQNGLVVMNSTEGRMEIYINGSWRFMANTVIV